MILNADIKIDKMQGAYYDPAVTLTNGHHYVMIDIEEAGLTADQFGIHARFSIIETKDKTKSWGFIKENKWHKGMSSIEERAMPIIGSAFLRVTDDEQQQPQQQPRRYTKTQGGTYGMQHGTDIPF